VDIGSCQLGKQKTSEPLAYGELDINPHMRVATKSRIEKKEDEEYKKNRKMVDDAMIHAKTLRSILGIKQ